MGDRFPASGTDDVCDMNAAERETAAMIYIAALVILPLVVLAARWLLRWVEQ